MFTKRDIGTEKVTIDYSYFCFDEETDRLYKQYTDKGYYIVDITPLGESSYLNRNRHFLVRYVKPKYHVHQKSITTQRSITQPLDDRLAPLQLKKTPNNAVKNMH